MDSETKTYRRPRLAPCNVSGEEAVWGGRGGRGHVNGRRRGREWGDMACDMATQM